MGAVIDQIAAERHTSRSAVIACLLATHPRLTEWRFTREDVGGLSKPFVDHIVFTRSDAA